MSGHTAKELNHGGSSLVEDPGIPLVGAAQGRFAGYSGTDNSAYVADSATSAGDTSANNMSGRRQDSQDSATEKASRGPTSGDAWTVMTADSAMKWENISYRLSRRKKLIKRQRDLVDVACVLAILGVFIMLVEAELHLQGYIHKTNTVSVILKLVITLSTIWLLVAVVAFHVTGIHLSMVDNGIEDWRLVTLPHFVCCVFLELLVCTIHPPPGDMEFFSKPAVESLLSILMFMRLYLLARFFVVHSHFVTNTATQSLGALNKVRIDAVFVFKATMSEKPGTLLLFLMGVIFIVSSWSVRACEAYMAVSFNRTSADVPGQILSEAMWMSAITFLTVGYGDVVPKSECGRVTAVVTGLLGVGTTALLVAVLAQKLEQTRAEKYVHTFVSRVAIDKAHKDAAANVIKNVLKLWRIRRPGYIGTSRRRIRVHGKLLQAVREMRNLKNAKSMIGESAVGVIEVNTAVAEVFRATEVLTDQQMALAAKTREMETRLIGIEDKLERILHAVLR